MLDTENSHELSTKVGTTPVVMVYLNVQTHDCHLVPRWATRVQEFPNEEVHEGQPSGIKILEGKRVQINGAIADLVRRGYTPLRFVVVDRALGTTQRMVIVLVHRDFVRQGERQLLDWQKQEIQRLTRDMIWNTRVYRNWGESGGNFIIESGNPRPAAKGAVSELVIADNQFEFVEPDSLRWDNARRMQVSTVSGFSRRLASSIVRKLKQL